MATIEQMRARMSASVWQALAQSGVDLSVIPVDQQEKLVNTITQNVLQAANAILDEDVPAQPEVEPVSDTEEIVLWKGRPFLSLTETYILTTERIKVTRGLLGRQIENFELVRIQDIDYSQGLTERLMGIGDITIRGADPSLTVMVMRNIPDPEDVYEIMRKAWLESRKRHGLQFREMM